MTRRALRLLEADGEVEIIALISKPADAETAAQLHQDLLALSKPVVACLLGKTPPDEGAVRYARTLTESAALIVDPSPLYLVQYPLEGRGGEGGAGRMSPPRPSEGVLDQAGVRGRVYGLFAGGTLCTEAQQVLDAMGAAHHLVDLGDDKYTRGRAHPIIDARLRVSMLAELAERQDAVAVLLDVILGDLAHPDPAGALRPALEAIGPLPVFAVLVGSRADPQGLERQRLILEEAGARVFASNAEAAAAAGVIAMEER
jgi:FdrA protein